MANAKTVFISYSSLDVQEANRVIRLLEQMQISYWKAPEMIPAGSSYAREIPQAIRDCKIFLLIVSQASQDSVWVEKEIDTAIHYRRTILPLRIDNEPMNDMFYFYLNNIQAIFYNNNVAAAFQALQQRLKFLLAEHKEAEDSVQMPEKTEKKQDSPQLQSAEVQKKTTGATQTQPGKVQGKSANRQLKPTETQKKRKDTQMRQGKGVTDEEDSSSENDNIPRFDPYRGSRASLTMNRIPYRCRYCGQNLRKISRGEYQCVQCGKKTYDDFQTIRNYLEKAGATPALTIEADTGVPLKNIEYFLREEYLEIPKLSSFRISCERCGSPIRTGYLCELCKRTEPSGSSRQTSSGIWRTGKRK